MKRRKYDWSEGSLSADECEFLRQLVARLDLNVNPIVELGTLIGRTTMLLACCAKEQRVLSIDCFRWNPWGMDSESQYGLAKLMLKPFIDSGKVELLKDRKEKFYARNGPGRIRPSLVVIDADHSHKSVKVDIAWARSVGAAIICGHDYYADGSKHPGVKQAVDEAGGPKELVESLWVL